MKTFVDSVNSNFFKPRQSTEPGVSDLVKSTAKIALATLIMPVVGIAGALWHVGDPGRAIQELTSAAPYMAWGAMLVAAAVSNVALFFFAASMVTTAAVATPIFGLTVLGFYGTLGVFVRAAIEVDCQLVKDSND